MADQIIGRGSGGTPALDTVSYYDDSEPNWNERPFFTRVEEKRKRTGFHIDVGSDEASELLATQEGFCATPASCGQFETRRQLAEHMASHGARVLLSGIAGDEFLAGVPTPIPELANHLSGGLFRTLAHQLKVWALAQRRPWLHLLLDTVRAFLPETLTPLRHHRDPLPWIQPTFRARNLDALTGYPERLHWFGPKPSFQENLVALEQLRRQLSCSVTLPAFLCDIRFPFMDRDLLEFLFAIPREQLVRPGQRRSLMRRALRDIVPTEVLNRRRKAFVARSPRIAIAKAWPMLAEMTQHMVSSSCGIVDARCFSGTLERAQCDASISLIHVLRTVQLERWLRCRFEPNVTAAQIRIRPVTAECT